MILKNNIKMSYLLLMTVLTSFSLSAQSLPEINYRDFGFHKQVNQVSTMYYSIDEGAIDKVEVVTRKFNKAGNLVSFENKSYLDDSWSKSTTTYKNGKAFQQFWKSSNPYLNRTYTYKYDKTGRVIQQDIKFKDLAKSYIKYSYKNGLLDQITADIDGVKSVSTHYYTTKKQLYKKIHRQLETGKKDIITNYFYLEGKEIMSYEEPKKYFNASTYASNNVEMKFNLIDDSDSQDKLLKGMLRFDKEAPMGALPFGLKEYSEQTLQFYQKNKDKLIHDQILIHLKNENKDIVAEGEVGLKFKDLAGINFSKITYADGKISGTTMFDNDAQAKLKKTLETLKLK